VKINRILKNNLRQQNKTKQQLIVVKVTNRIIHCIRIKPILYGMEYVFKSKEGHMAAEINLKRIRVFRIRVCRYKDM
jgi:hypothetical protein